MPLGAFRLNSLAKTVVASAPSGRTPITVTAYGNAQVDTAQSKFGGASALFDGIDDYLEASGNYWNVAVGSPRTFECWVRSDDINDAIDTIMSSRTTGGGTVGWRWEISSDGGTQGELRLILWDSGSSADVVYSSNAISANTWHHVAYVWDGVDNHSLYIDGTRGLSHTASDTASANTVLRIGNEFDTTNTRGWDGYIDEVRVSDIARYSGASFTAPSAPFQNDDNTLLLLHMDGTDGSTTFVDDVATVKATGGEISSFYDGSDYYVVHTFKSNGTFTPSESLTADALIVAGGGGGGNGNANGAGGGGGGGQVRYITGESLSATGYTITIGNGGAAGAQGSTSSAFSYSSEGGGYGGNGPTGGAGQSVTDSNAGGGSGYFTSGRAGGTSTNGYNGGNGQADEGGGGGGAGGNGENAGVDGTNFGGDGGNGYASTNTFNYGTTYYAGGGGGGCIFSVHNPGQGTHGGGDGGDSTTGSPGTANTGGGGGGGGDLGGGSGGSGIVVVRYLG